jgi:hypothetical protein
MKTIKWFAPFFALIAVLCCSTLASASSRTALNSQLAGVSTNMTNLLPDPTAYCMKNPPYQQQQQDNDWHVQFKNVVGDANQNNWGCQYLVQATVPIAGFDGTTSGFLPLPPFTYTQPINWNDMCNQQYPGAFADWLPGQETGAYGTPWVCVGAPGVIYDPAEQYDGTHQVISVPNSGGGGGW